MEYLDSLNLHAPATREEIAEVFGQKQTPDGYVGFLLFSNGAEGYIGDNYLILFAVGRINLINAAAQTSNHWPGLLIFASDGGGTSYAFDTKADKPPILEFYDDDLGGEVRYCAPSFSAFLKYIAELEE